METGTLVHVDPSDLLIDTNVRTQVRIDAKFKASIKSEGVIVPLVAISGEDGLLVRDGQRRTLAAVEVAEPAVPVYVVSNDGEADRIIGQIAANKHRADLTAGEEVTAVQQLSMIGVSAKDIAKRTQLPRRHVDTAIAITGNDKAMKIAGEHTLAVAGWCNEFAADEAKVAQILRESEWGGEARARHTVELYRQQAKDDAAYAEAAATITEQTVIARPEWRDAAKRVEDLVDDTKKPLDPEAHTSCPGHVVVLVEVNDHQPEDAAEAKPQSFDRDVAGRKWIIDAWCSDPEAHGHRGKWGSTGSSKPSAAEDPMAKEKASAERKRVLAGNKAWDAASIVRAEFVEKLLGRKAAPDGAVLFVLRALTGQIDLGAGRDVLREKVGTPKSGHGQIKVPDLTAPAATMGLLALIVTGMENGLGRNDWRNDSLPTQATALYLKALKSWGYCLSDVEVAASGGKKFTVSASQ